MCGALYIGRYLRFLNQNVEEGKKTNIGLGETVADHVRHNDVHNYWKKVKKGVELWIVKSNRALRHEKRRER